MKREVIATAFGAMLSLIGTFLYDDYVKAKLSFVVSETPGSGVDIVRSNYIVTISNNGIRPAEDITCRICVNSGTITRATSVVHGESKSISPDYPNAIFDRISYLNHGRSATFEIEAEGHSAGGLFVLIIGKGVQAEDKTPPQEQTQKSEVSIGLLVIGAIAIFGVLMLPNKRNAATGC